MQIIAERNVLLRKRVELPAGMKLAVGEFSQGWNLLRTGGSGRLEKKIQMHGWNFIRISDGLQRSGVGDTSPQAVDLALKIALRRVSEYFNAAEVAHIEVTEYPWFFLARIRVYPCRIQQGVVEAVPDEAMPRSVPPGRRRLPFQSAEMFPDFGSAMPMLREMLIASRTPREEIQ